MKIVCEACGKMGQLQHLSKNYYRVKHYLGSVNGKLKFEYHKQSLEHINRILVSKQTKQGIDPIDQKNIDQNLKESSSNNENISRGSLAWFGRQTHNLENKTGQVRPSVQRSRARIPPPALENI